LMRAEVTEKDSSATSSTLLAWVRAGRAFGEPSIHH
jgi:hypothetical protein